MSTGTLFEIGKAYSFSIYPTTIISNDFNYAICEGVLSPSIAEAFMPLDVMHAQVYPYLPSGTVDNPLMYNYVKFKLSDGATSVLGLPWINLDTVKVSTIQKIVVEIKGKTANELNNIRSVLTENGYDDISIHVVEDASALLKK